MAEYIENESIVKNKTDLENEEWVRLQLVGVDDILKDGNFTRFLSYHHNCIKLEDKTNVENQTN